MYNNKQDIIVNDKEKQLLKRFPFLYATLYKKVVSTLNILAALHDGTNNVYANKLEIIKNALLNSVETGKVSFSLIDGNSGEYRNIKTVFRGILFDIKFNNSKENKEIWEAFFNFLDKTVNKERMMDDEKAL